MTAHIAGLPFEEFFAFPIAASGALIYAARVWLSARSKK
jgi:hypothetical protein